MIWKLACGIWVKSKSSSFYWYFSCIRYVTHDRVHCHWRWQCHDPLFACFDNWIKAPLTNSVMVWLLKLSHLMPGEWGDQFLSGKFWIARYLQLLLVLLRIFRAYLTRISRYLGIYLHGHGKTGPSGYMLHRCQLCVEISGGYVEDVDA